MSRIAHPRFQPGRSKGLAGIEFIDGFAEVDLPGDGILRQALVQHGYRIEDAAVAVRPSKASKRSGKATPAKAANASDEAGPFAVVELSDGTVVGDGKSLVTLHDDDGTATAED